MCCFRSLCYCFLSLSTRFISTYSCWCSHSCRLCISLPLSCVLGQAPPPLVYVWPRGEHAYTQTKTCTQTLIPSNLVHACIDQVPLIGCFPHADTSVITSGLIPATSELTEVLLKRLAGCKSSNII